ncbi:ChaN family lipoprotein [Vitiosangium sp. GDMCC 1.1324]|uniref:ChaN family lipoprotein n=1 Tax=Vitiosangium sp. (strain GDMCC 1.1324) TaxID=2138576 RepID=UPI000D35577A|nr:ChaN family lipoprotein [Vitiosangium sp. GDMCC 1.1324]PTL81171.1 hypothetical protein DAT35_23900 [Vitiosangium sp. GDMCC 1.1324]
MKILFSLLAMLIFPTFARAETPAEHIKSNAREFKNLDVSPALLGSIENHKLILLGESHGTNEMPDYAFKIIEAMAQKHDVAIGLEFPTDIQGQIDSFLKTGDEKVLAALDFFQDANYHSGRGSEAMVRLLKNIRTLPRAKVFCFDIPKPQKGQAVSNDRDTKMAMTILDFIKKNPSRTVITFSGNLHSRLTVGTPWDPDSKNMGSEVLRLSKGALSLKNSRNLQFRYDEGAAWQCWPDSNEKIVCGGKTFGPVNTVYRTAVPFERYFLEEPEMTDGHFNSIFIKRVSASLPWKLSPR